MVEFHNTHKIRTSSITTAHGVLQTPAFMPDATYGTVQGLSNTDLIELDVPAIVTTTLHIEQSIGSNYIASMGGFHKFTSWDRPLLTDSGGFQVYSLIHARKHKHNKITDAGCSFVDYKSGDYKFLTPEISQQIQHNIGADMRIVLDEPVMNIQSLAIVKKSVERTIEWAKRSKTEFMRLLNITEAEFNDKTLQRPLLGAVVQGGNNMELRAECAKRLIDIGFDMYCLGGMPLRNKKTWDYTDEGGFHKELLQMLAEMLPDDKLRYALGVGTPDDLAFCMQVGWDIFDTVLPTRNARHGYIYTDKGLGDTSYERYDVLHIKNTRYAQDTGEFSPFDIHPELAGVSKAWLRYLIKSKSRTGERLASLHNLGWYQNFMQKFVAANAA